MQVSEGRLIKRALVQHVETTGATERTLIDIVKWLHGYGSLLNLIELRVLVMLDFTSSYATGDSYAIMLKTYAMKLQQKATSFNSYSWPIRPIIFPIATTVTPTGAGEINLKGHFHNWLATETHRALILVHAYLMPEDVGPRELAIRTF